MVCHAFPGWTRLVCLSSHPSPQLYHLALHALRPSYVGLPSGPGLHLLLPPQDLCKCCSLCLGYTWSCSLIVNLCILQTSAKSTTSSRKPSLTSYFSGASVTVSFLFSSTVRSRFLPLGVVTIIASTRLSEAMPFSVHFPVSGDQHNEYLWNA